jgi:hypothetical protein
VRQLQTELSATRGKIAMYIGIANGVTSAQALSELLAMGIEPFVVDMGSNVRIYHPKIYASIGPDSAQIIMGSANLTYSGLNENVEASTVMTLDKSDAQDLAFITSVESTLGSLSTDHPFNVFKVKNQADVRLLVDEGRLEDESIKRAAIVTGHRDLGTIPRIIPNFPIKRRAVQAAVAPVVPSLPTAGAMGLVWRSKELTERDLSIPSGSNTNPTGSMYLKKGLLDGIDQRHYFRDRVFRDLTWRRDQSLGKMHLERAHAQFEIVIDGISMGVFLLRITHNTDTNSTTYNQNNAMTQIHWGDARTLVGRRDLLGKFLTLYNVNMGVYQIEIN